MHRLLRGAVALCALALVVPVGTPAVAATVTPLPVGVRADYQLGGNRSVPASVGIVARDRKAAPAPGKYNICYVNGFQTQPDEQAFWRDRPALLLRRDGRPVADEAWGEWLLDTRTEAKRTRLAAIVGRWIDRCARDGFDAVEFDNLDSWDRSHRMIRPAANAAFARLLVARAHRAGLAAGQKNWSEWNGRKVGFDFAIAEECGRWRECGAYLAHYGRRVVDIEYRNGDFAVACDRWGSRISIVRRDLALAPTGVRRWCP